MNRTLFCDGWLFCENGKEKRPVTLPHDAAQAMGRDKNAPSGRAGAFFKNGVYTYEKTFYVPEDWEGRELIVEFEGVYPNAAVSLNGARLGGCRYGYSLFQVTLEGLKAGEMNTLTVEVDDSRHPNSRWYAGAGIYRPVWLLSAPKEHILPNGVEITTVSLEPAWIHVEISLSEAAEAVRISREELELETEIFFGEAKVASASGEACAIRIPDARLWDAESPNLYTCLVTLRRDGEVLDTHKETFGIRKVSWSEKGLFVNGKETLLKGGCIHHDNGILGARSFAESEWRRIRKLKEFGFNAIRSAHNPLCRAALEACDALGMYVMDEAWDTWTYTKNAYDHGVDFPECYETDLEQMVAKDQNHPCVILYSIGNEVTEPAKPEGVELAKKIIAHLKDLDDTRPVTAGINLTLLLLASMENNPLAAMAGGGTAGSAAAQSAQSGEGAADGIDESDEKAGAGGMAKMDSTAYNKMVSENGKLMTMAAATEAADQISAPVLDLLDIAGYNYAASRYEKEGELHPGRVVVGSETYPYELNTVWKLVEKYPYVVGDFMWTAWDYLGEVGIGGWSYSEEDKGFEKAYPWLLADTGAFDILGNDNAEAGMAAVVWGARKEPYIGVCPVNHPGVTPIKAMWRGSNALPYWSYRGCAGNEAEVEVYSAATEVELLVNGKTVGRKTTVDDKAVFHTIYEPGELKAVAYEADGSVQAESSLHSADENIRIAIRPEKNGFEPGEILYVDVLLTGENGEIECNADTELQIAVEGGELLAFGSADPKTEDDYLSGRCHSYYGRALAVVRAKGPRINLRVSGEGLAAHFSSLGGFTDF